MVRCGPCIEILNWSPQYRERPLSTLANSMKIVRGYQIEKWISRIKFDQESSKTKIFDGFHRYLHSVIPCDAKRSKTGLGRFLICPKMVKNSQMWSNYVILWLKNGFLTSNLIKVVKN